MAPEDSKPADGRHATNSVAKVDHEVAVGEDLDFQRRWWRFERLVWTLFIAAIVLDLCGAFGRGPLANAAATTADRSLEATYERIERKGTPSTMTVAVNTVADPRHVEIFMSDAAISGLGLQRVIPAPEATTVGNGGLTYRFVSATLPAVVRFEFQPVAAGVYHVMVGAAGKIPLRLAVAVVP
jgi:hypothetical protein